MDPTVQAKVNFLNLSHSIDRSFFVPIDYDYILEMTRVRDTHFDRRPVQPFTDGGSRNFRSQLHIQNFPRQTPSGGHAPYPYIPRIDRA